MEIVCFGPPLEGWNVFVMHHGASGSSAQPRPANGSLIRGRHVLSRRPLFDLSRHSRV